MSKTLVHGTVGLDVDQIAKTLEELEGDIAALREELKRVKESRRGGDEYLLAYA